MYIDDKGIVLRCIKYDDKSFIAHLFTASHGHASFIINESRSKRSGASARLFQPLSFLSFQWNPKPTATLHRMKEVHTLFIQQEIPLHPIKRGIAMVIAEFMAYALSNETENRELYDYIEHSIQWFDTTPDKFSNFHLVFLLKLTRFLGIAPNMEEYSQGSSFDLAHGCFIPPSTPSPMIMDKNDTLLFFRLSESNYNTMDNITMNRHDRARLIQYIATHYTLHTPKFPEIKSLDILQEVFNN